MRKIIAKLIEWHLRVWVAVLKKRHRPRVIAITGSIGKTSAKEAIAVVLEKKYPVLRPEKSYNTPIGLLLGMLGLRSGYSSFRRWLKIIFVAPVRAFTIPRAKIWVLEMGADKPGDIAELTKFIHPHIGVLLNVNPAHLDKKQFDDLDAIFEEKEKIVTCLKKDGTAILNADDPRITRLKDTLRSKIVWFSAQRKTDIWAAGVTGTRKGITGTFKTNTESATFHIPVIGSHHVSLFLPAVACGMLFGVSLEECVEALSEFRLPPGRMTLIAGLHQSLLIDSSYNASPIATEAALQVLREMPGKRRIAVLGSMNELGTYAEEAHRKIGVRASEFADMLLCVGDQAKWYAVAAIDNGMPPEKIFTFDRAERAGEFLQENLQTGDVVLFKGSQNRVRLERAIALVMKEPERAKELLVRQEREWQNIL